MALLDADFPLTEIKHHFVIVFIIYKMKIERNELFLTSNKWCDHFILSFCSVIKLNCNGKYICPKMYFNSKYESTLVKYIVVFVYLLFVQAK